MIASGPALVLQPTASPVTATTSAHRQAVSRSAKERPTSTAGRHIGNTRNRFQQALTDPSLPLRDRVRMACSLGAVFGGLLMAGHAFDNVPNAELGSQIRDALRDLVADHSA